MSTASPTAPSASPILAAVNALRAAGESRNAEVVADLLAADVVFHSPMSGTKVFEGKDDVTALHRDIFAVLHDIHTTEPLTLGDTGSFMFRARVRDVEMQAMNLVRVNGAGKIAEYTVFVRPLPA